MHHESALGTFRLGSDAISHSYRNHKRKKWLTNQIPEEVDQMFEACTTIGAYVVFPKNKIDRKFSINQARGINKFIDDRFDLTLECIRLFYSGQESPLYATLLRYKDFFDLFQCFEGYVDFFLLNDLVDDKGKIRFYLEFDGFKTKPAFYGIEDYLTYKKKAMAFINARNARILTYVSKNGLETNTV